MKIIVKKDYEQVSQAALEIMLDIIKNKPNAALGLATGSTPIRLYELMQEDHLKNHTSYKNIESYNLDEYYGLSDDNPQSYYYFMWHHLFNKLKNNNQQRSADGGGKDIAEPFRQSGKRVVRQ